MKSGIYEIKNTVNGKSYVGSSKSIKKRFIRHRWQLRKNEHHCIYLQRSWNKHTETNFEFNILEECSKDITETELFLKEEWYLQNYNIGKLYNVGSVGGGDNTSNHPDNLKIREKISQANKLRFANRTEEEKIAHSNSMKGENNPNYGNTWSDEARQAASNTRKQMYIDNPVLKDQYAQPLLNWWKNISDEEYEKFIKHCESRTGEKNPFFGKEHTDETKLKIANRHKQTYENATIEEKHKLKPNMRAVIIDGRYFISIAEAARFMDVCTALIIFRIKSKNKRFKAYNFA